MNALNKQLRRVSKVWSLAWGLGVGLTSLGRKTTACYVMLHTTLDSDGFLGTILTPENEHGLAHGILGVCAGQIHLTAVARELAKHVRFSERAGGEMGREWH